MYTTFYLLNAHVCELVETYLLCSTVYPNVLTNRSYLLYQSACVMCLRMHTIIYHIRLLHDIVFGYDIIRLSLGYIQTVLQGISSDRKAPCWVVRYLLNSVPVKR